MAQSASWVINILSVLTLTAPAARADVVRLTGEQLKAKLAGAPATVVNFWATWCGPCKEEFPDLVKAQKKYSPKGARFLIVSMDFDSQEKAIQSFLKEKSVDFETYWRLGNEMEFINTLLPKWSGAIPTTAFFDREGKLIKMIQAKVTTKSLAQNIDGILKTDKPAAAEPEPATTK